MNFLKSYGETEPTFPRKHQPPSLKLLIVDFSLICGLSRALFFLPVFLPNEQTKPQLQLELWCLVTYEKDHDQCWSQAPSPTLGSAGPSGQILPSLSAARSSSAHTSPFPFSRALLPLLLQQMPVLSSNICVSSWLPSWSVYTEHRDPRYTPNICFREAYCKKLLAVFYRNWISSRGQRDPGTWG